MMRNTAVATVAALLIGLIDRVRHRRLDGLRRTPMTLTCYRRREIVTRRVPAKI